MSGRFLKLNSLGFQCAFRGRNYSLCTLLNIFMFILISAIYYNKQHGWIREKPVSTRVIQPLWVPRINQHRRPHILQMFLCRICTKLSRIYPSRQAGSKPRRLRVRSIILTTLIELLHGLIQGCVSSHGLLENS